MVEVLQSRVLLRPEDMDASLGFYEDRLGLTRYREWGRRPRRGVVFFLGGGFLELTERPPSALPPPPPARVRLWLQVEDLQHAHDELRDRGVEIEEPPERKPWGLLEMAVRDPDGLQLILIETPVDHPLRRRQ